MADEILINVTPLETRVAVVENGIVQEILIERIRKRGLVGNIYKGKVCRVLPGMNAAFVEIGLQRAAFLHASDLHKNKNAVSHYTGEIEPIERLLHEGQELLVQVIKDPLGNKGARLTTEISIPSRYQVYMPLTNVSGVSIRIECESERERLKQCLSQFQVEQQEAGGYIARTAAEGVDESVLRADMLFLMKLWIAIASKVPETKIASLVYEDLPLSMRVVRDMFHSRIDKIRVDSRETHHKLVQFAEEFMSNMAPRIEHYAGGLPVFDIYGVEDEIQKALERKVKLKSGGYLIFDQTEAMSTIDVNTGSFVGKHSLEETIFKTNLEAAQAIARQLRVRNLGGIIIIDFIDMLDDKHKEQVLLSLGRCLEKDHAKTSISGVSALGLVEMTRKRTRESLEQVFCECCSTCEGRGVIKTAETTCLEIFREIIREVRQYQAEELLVLASNEVVERLLDEEANNLSELEIFLGVRIRYRPEIQYSQEQYDVVLL